MKLDRLLAKHESMGRNRARLAITDGQILVDGKVEARINHEVDRFRRIEMDGAVIQAGERLLHVMLHKPRGVVSATRDAEHVTVIDLIVDPDRNSLHLVGRLDRDTSGLMLLTNDGRWSKALMHPDHKVPKVYLVETRDVIALEAVELFAAGFHFHTENLTTMPAELEILSDRTARLTLHEGRYHQVKRMFHRIGNRVTALHRERIGALTLAYDLAPGEWRFLTNAEIAGV